MLSKVLPGVVFLLGLSLLLLNESIPLLFKSFRATQWPKVTGVIVDADFVAQKRHIKSSEKKFWSPALSYSYLVNGEKYVAHRIHLNFKEDRLHSWNDVEKMKAAYPEGLSVDVYYNPRDPADAILINTLGYYNGFNSLVSLFVILIPVAVVWFVFK